MVALVQSTRPLGTLSGTTPSESEGGSISVEGQTDPASTMLTGSKTEPVGNGSGTITTTWSVVAGNYRIDGPLDDPDEEMDPDADYSEE